ncbi:hypothetical protein [Pseudolabrys sp. FHR47]|uniref:hypothetical protein n=1 Tax=Pseudolabrys sp. FHR47 TaxID=2562284 RepID=UPI0010BEAEDA|nr:hypothetical protein [Pseudolabrys sp. FHR47]
MRRLPRIALLSLLVLAAPVLSGCANFDPDNLDIFGLNEKKKLPGERKDLFPEGVPGVSQGIPPEYRMGAQTAAGADAAAAQQPAAAPVEPQKPKPAPKRTVKRTTPKPTAAAPVAPVQSQEAPAAQQTSQPSSGWPAPAQGTTSSSGASGWPAPQPSGTFQR